MTSVAIMPARESDAEGIASVHSAAWRAAFTFLPSRFLEAMTVSVVLGKWQDDLLDPSSSLFVAIGDGQLLGFLQLRADGHEGEVMSLYVEPASWGQNIGTTLLAFGEEWLVDHGAHTALLWTAEESRQARAFYERRGWVLTGREQTQLLGPAEVALHEVEYRRSLG